MRRRILFTIVAITTLAVTVFAVPLAVAVGDTYGNAARLGLQREAAAATIEVPADFPTSADGTEVPVPDGGTTIGVYRSDGTRVAGVGPDTADAVVQQALAGDAADGLVGDQMVAVVPISRDEVVIGAVRAAQPRAAVDARIWRARVVMLLLGVAAIALAAAVATRQTRRLSRPLDQLTVSAQRLGDGDFTVRNTPSGLGEIDAAGRAMDRTAERLGRLIERERAFSADVSHQLRTPLTGLRLELENALTTPGVDPAEAIGGALDAIDRIEATIEDLLALARDTSAHQGELELDAVLTELDETWRRPLADKGRRLHISSPAGVPPVAVSTAAVRQILAVLVDNSTEHGAGTVDVTVHPSHDGFVLDVSDEGPGLRGDPEDAFRRRFDQSNGRGIGLSLARSLAEAEGGSLSFVREPSPHFRLSFGDHTRMASRQRQATHHHPDPVR